MITLKDTTGNADIDEMLTGVITVYEAAFPNRIRGYYLVGSYGDNTPVSTSDIDLEIIVKGSLTPEEDARQQAIKDGLRAIAPIGLDLPLNAEDDLHKIDTVAIVQASKFVYGEDTRTSIPLPSIDLYLRRITTPVQRGLTFRFRTENVTLPLNYPLPDDEFYGYVPERWKGAHGDIKMWVLNIGWLTTFLIAQQAGIFVPSKRHMLPLYRDHINDEWTEFLTEVYENGRTRWAYNLPESTQEQALMRDLCRQTLAFENHVARIYVDYLRDEVKHGDRDLAEERLAKFNIP